MHAVFVAGRAADQEQGQRQGPAGDRRRPDDRVPDGHPRARRTPAGGSSTTSSSTPSALREITILDISDYHAQLTPLAEAADNLAAPAVNATFGIGGSAFLKAWFDVYEAESAHSATTARRSNVLEVAGGDSFGGATPPISNFFGDKPTPPIMRMMGIDLDAVGNHSFDRGQTYLRNELIPLADVPDDQSPTSSSRTARRRPEWSTVEGVRLRARRQARLRRLHDRVDARDRLPGEPRSVRGAARRSGGQRRGGEARQEGRRDRRTRPRGRDRRHGQRPDRGRSSTSPTASRTSTS